MRDYASVAQGLVRILGPEGARELLWLLDQSDGVRAEAFRQLHGRGTHPSLEDALVHLESDDVWRGWLAEYLRLELGLA